MNKNMVKTKNIKLFKIGIFALLFLFTSMKLLSAISVDSNYITIYPGEQGKVSIDIENNENFDIEDFSIDLDLSRIPFTSVGSSQRDIDNIDEDDEEKFSFTLRASTDSVPGDYEIPYTIKYTNADDSSEKFQKQGSFGIRISSKTEIDYSIGTNGAAVVGKEGQISLEIVNKGLGEIKSITVQMIPDGFQLLSKDKIFVGSIDGDDTDIATFDVIYKKTNPIFRAKIEFKDFDNNIQTDEINIPLKVYTKEEALQAGIIEKNNGYLYLIIIIALIVTWIIYRRIKKVRKRNDKMKEK